MALAELTTTAPIGEIFGNITRTECPSRPATFYSLDVDHVVWNQGSIRENGVFQIQKYSESTQKIFSDLVSKTLDGDIVLLNTGKGVNFMPLLGFLEQAVYEEAQKRGMVTGHHLTDEDGKPFTVYEINDEYRDPHTKRLLTSDKNRPLMMFFSMENGAHWYDVFDPQKRPHQHVLPIEMWETLANGHITQLIQDSTDKKRIETLARVTPQYKKPENYRPIDQPVIPPTLSDEELLHAYQDRVGHLACVSPWNTKINLVIDIEKVITTPDLIKQWGELARTPILEPSEYALERKEQKRIAGERLLRTLRRLLPTNNIFHSYANGTHFYDIAPGGIDKATVIREIQNYVTRTYRTMGLSNIIPDFSRTVVIGDGNPVDSNDAPMYRVGAAFSNRRYENGPRYIGDVLAHASDYSDSDADEIEKVRRFLAYANENPQGLIFEYH